MIFDPIQICDMNNEELVSFVSIGASIRIGKLQISGDMKNFAFLGDGTFVTKPGFGVFVSINSADPNALKWPSWLPIQITAIGITWNNINDNPSDFRLIISASVKKLFNLPLKVSGAVTGLVIEPSLLLAGKFPIVDLESFSVSVSGKLFVASVSGSLMLLCQTCDLRDLGFCDLVRIDTADAFSLRMDLEHDPRRRRPIQRKDFFEHLHDEFHGQIGRAHV